MREGLTDARLLAHYVGETSRALSWVDSFPPAFACSEISQCTGTLIGERRQHVLTAAHCLVDNSQGSGTAYEKISFYPGLDGNVQPFGTVNAAQVRLS